MPFPRPFSRTTTYHSQLSSERPDRLVCQVSLPTNDIEKLCFAAPTRPTYMATERMSLSATTVALNGALSPTVVPLGTIDPIAAARGDNDFGMTGAR